MKNLPTTEGFFLVFPYGNPDQSFLFFTGVRRKSEIMTNR